MENLYKQISLSIPVMLVNAQHIHFSAPFKIFYSVGKSSMMLSADPSFKNMELHPLPFVQKLQ